MAIGQTMDVEFIAGARRIAPVEVRRTRAGFEARLSGAALRSFLDVTFEDGGLIEMLGAGFAPQSMRIIAIRMQGRDTRVSLRPAGAPGQLQ